MTRFPSVDDLILGRDKRICDRCGEWTYWMRPRQTKKGFCHDHARPGVPVDERSATTTLLRAFPGVGVEFTTTSPRYPPDVYGQEEVKVVVTGRWLRSGEPTYQVATAPPLDAGPCEGCRRTIRRYGPEGYPYCTECEPIS